MRDIIKREAQNILEKAISIRREIHRNPELGFNEFKTSSLIKNFLEDLGLQVTANVGGTGVVGLLKGERAGKTVAIRADMDALSITEENESEYSSINKGVMHACGHDAHVALVLGTAKVLAGLKEQLAGNVKFIFQPAEEGLGGARLVIEEGALENPAVDYIIAAHVNPYLQTGRISVKAGPIMASPSEFEIKVIGKGGHAAQPHNAVDPIAIGVTLVNSLQTIITREKNPVENAVLSVTCFNAGSAFNVIPGSATIKGTVRTFSPGLDRWIARRMEEMTRSITSAMGGSYRFEYWENYPPVVNNPEVVDSLVASAKRILGEDSVDTQPESSMLAEDFSYYIQRVPGAMFSLGCMKEGSEVIHNLHSSKFEIDEECIRVGIEVMAQFTVDMLLGV